MSVSSELNRYAQQIKLAEMGIGGQEKLKQAKVLCIGAGGIAVTLLPYLAAAGVGTIGIVDDDLIDLGNLHRQILYQEKQVGEPKVSIAKMQLEALNSTIMVQTYERQLLPENAEQLIGQYDLVADCTDNFFTRYLIHDTCFRLNKPYVYASAYQFQGHCSLFYGQDNPCLHCLFPIISPDKVDCQSGGILGTLPGFLGIIQATEIIKWITGMGGSLLNRLLSVNFLTMQVKNFQLTKNPQCQFCINGQSIAVDAFASGATHSFAILPQALPDFLNKNPDTLLLDVRTLAEHQLQNIGGKLIPLYELSARLNELELSQTILIYCHSGQRSMQACHLLREAGFYSVYYLAKGMSAKI